MKQVVGKDFYKLWDSFAGNINNEIKCFQELTIRNCSNLWRDIDFGLLRTIFFITAFKVFIIKL